MKEQQGNEKPPEEDFPGDKTDGTFGMSGQPLLPPEKCTVVQGKRWTYCCAWTKYFLTCCWALRAIAQIERLQDNARKEFRAREPKKSRILQNARPGRYIDEIDR